MREFFEIFFVAALVTGIATYSAGLAGLIWKKSMTKTFTTTKGATYTCESTKTIACPRDIVEGRPTMKLIERSKAEHVFVFGHPADMCDNEANHTV